jgi:tryptophanyl-tRNA synthetase
MAIKTGSEPVGSPLNPDDIVLKIFALYDEAGAASLRERYLAGAVGYKEAKELLAKTIIDATHDMRVRRRDITKEEIIDVLRKGRSKAKKFASAKMEKVRRRIGVDID